MDTQTLFLVSSASVLGGAELLLQKLGAFLASQGRTVVWQVRQPELFQNLPGEIEKLEALKRYDLNAMAKLRRRYRSASPAAILFNMAVPTDLQPAIMVSAAAGLSRVCLHHSPFHINTSPLQIKLARWELETIPHHVTVGEVGRQELNQNYRVPMEHIAHWYPGIDLLRFQADGENYRHRSELQRGPIIGHVGRLGESKGQWALIRATSILAAGYPDLKLVLVGDGPDLEKLKRLAVQEKVENRVWFAPFTKDIDQWYRTFDVFCLPSKNESVPLSVLEAMACGVPVICSAVGNLKYMLEGTEAVFTAGDPAALAGDVEHVLRNRDLMQSMKVKMRRRVETEFNQDRQLDLFAKLLEQLMVKHN